MQSISLEGLEFLAGGGLVCDNPGCDWEDKDIKNEDLPDWINKPCPKCGVHTVLTQEDYDKVIEVETGLKEAFEIASTYSPEEQLNIIESFGVEIPEGLDMGGEAMIKLKVAHGQIYTTITSIDKKKE